MQLRICMNEITYCLSRLNTIYCKVYIDCNNIKGDFTNEKTRCLENNEENQKVSKLSNIMQDLSSNMEEINDYTAMNVEVSNKLKMEIAKFKVI